MKICVQIPCQLDQGETQTQCLKYVGVTNIFLRFLYAIGEKMLHFLGHDTVGKMMFTKKWLSGNWASPIFGKNKVPAPIATLRNLNIVQNGKSSKPAFRSMFMWKSRFQGFKFVGIFRKASLFSFWASGIAAFRTLFLLKPRTQVYHKISQENSNLKGS